MLFITYSDLHYLACIPASAPTQTAESVCNVGDWVSNLGQEDPLQENGNHSCILPGGLIDRGPGGL